MVFRRLGEITMKKLRYYIENNLSLPKILILAFVLRLIWILVIKTVPTSDFKLMYETGKLAAEGNFAAFHGLSYFNLFPHDSITVLYYSLFFKITNNPLFLIKFMNVVYETFVVYMIYVIGKNIYNKNLAKLGAFLIAIFPPFIMYCSETMAEHMAIPFFLVSVYFFIKFIDTDSILFIFLSGIFLSLGDLFRPVGIIFFIAYLIYFVIKKLILQRKKYLIKLLAFIILVIGCALPTVILSNILVKADILQNQIWQPAEPSITTVLKGTNFEALGAWNVEDAKVPSECHFNAKLTTEKSMQLIKQRFESHSIPEIIKFYAEKTFLQWGIGDYGAYGWTVLNNAGESALKAPSAVVIATISYIIISLYYIFILVFAVKGIFNLKNSKQKGKVMFIYLILLGFIGFYMLTERQSRYSFVCSWTLILTALNGFKLKE